MSRPLLDLTEVRVRFGEVTALAGVSLQVAAGDCLGLIGHNGAGKSTLIALMNGGLALREGGLAADGAPVTGWGIGPARARGIRCVFQELSLCPNLSLLENARLMHPEALRGRFWRPRAAEVVQKALDAIFPGHGLSPRTEVGALSIARRQMVEIALAFAPVGPPPRLVILDEPTSSLDARVAGQLLEHVRRFVAGGGAVVIVSHILGEVLPVATRIVVMKDGRIVAEPPVAGLTPAALVEAMGSTAPTETAARSLPDQAARPEVLRLPGPPGAPPLLARRGEVIGLAGLGGHGQTEALIAAFDRLASEWRVRRAPRVAFVAGDRRLNGTFDLWSILHNLTAAVLPDLTQRSLIDRGAESALGHDWRARIGIRTPDLGNPILSLSGGNQQKVLFARALATTAPVILMDDPMRGVDVGTKREVYDLIRAEAARGRTFLWYSTELAEMTLCDRVYVFRDRAIVADLHGAALREDALLASSFSEGVA